MCNFLWVDPFSTTRWTNNDKWKLSTYLVSVIGGGISGVCWRMRLIWRHVWCTEDCIRPSWNEAEICVQLRYWIYMPQIIFLLIVTAGGTDNRRLKSWLTLWASLSSTFLQTLPDLVTPVEGHSLSPCSCPCHKTVLGVWSWLCPETNVSLDRVTKIRQLHHINQ